MSKLTRDFEEFIKGKHPNIEFRPQQKEAIVDIISAYEEDHNGIYLLDAPTGSGKTIVGEFALFATTHIKQRCFTAIGIAY